MKQTTSETQMPWWLNAAKYHVSLVFIISHPNNRQLKHFYIYPDL